MNLYLAIYANLVKCATFELIIIMIMIMISM